MPAGQAQPECQSPIDQIAYCSLAAASVHSLAIVSQLQAAAPSITGLLMWHDRLLIHWLEGSAKHIEALWAQVQNDAQQHCVVRLLHRQGHAKRLFVDWTMRATSRQDMMVVVRQAKELSGRESDDQALQWQHAISTLSILLNPELTQLYAQAACPGKPMQKPLHD